MTDADMKNDFKQFKGIDPHFVFMSKVVKPVETPLSSTKSVSTSEEKITDKLTYLTPPSEVDMSLKFNTRQVHMYTLKLLNYITNNQSLRELCMSDPESLLTVFEKSSNMKLIHTMLKQSQSSLNDLDNGSSNGMVTNLIPVTDEVSASENEENENEENENEENENEDSSDALTTNSIEQQLISQITTMFSGSGFNPTFITSAHGSTPSFALSGPILSDEDRENIKRLADMGFSESNAQHAYLISGKNLDVALTILLSE
jgi:hypothetical protein